MFAVFNWQGNVKNARVECMIFISFYVHGRKLITKSDFVLCFDPENWTNCSKVTKQSRSRRDSAARFKMCIQKHTTSFSSQNKFFHRSFSPNSYKFLTCLFQIKVWVTLSIYQLIDVLFRSKKAAIKNRLQFSSYHFTKRTLSVTS